MSYGAKIYNTSGQVVIDDTEISYLLSQEFSLSGVSIGAGLFSYSFSSMPETALPAFVNLSVGQFLGGGASGYVSTQSSLTFLSLRPANQLPDPTGYDVVFYNDSSEKTWIASASVSVLNSFAVIPVNGSFTSDADYVSLLTRIPYFATDGSGVNVSLSTGVFRSSASLYSWQARATGSGPPVNVGPYPVSCMFAKST